MSFKNIKKKIDSLKSQGYFNVAIKDRIKIDSIKYKFILDLNQKFESFGWKVLEVEEGNSLDKVYETLSTAKENSKKGKPIVILMKTVMGNGVDFMMHTHEWHGKAPNDDQLKVALNQNPETLGDY